MGSGPLSQRLSDSRIVLSPRAPSLGHFKQAQHGAGHAGMPASALSYCDGPVSQSISSQCDLGIVGIAIA